MNYQIIKTFLTIAELGSMADAGKKLHFSQQVVSEHLKQLENELGVQLVLRKKGSRQTALTTDGSDFLPLARSWAEFQAKFDEQVEHFVRSRGHNVFRLAASSSAHQYIISHIVHKLMQRFPELELRLSTMEIRDLPAAIASQAFDAAFVFEAKQEYPNITTIPLFLEERWILCPANTTLPDRLLSVKNLNPRFEVLYDWYLNNKEHMEWRQQHFAAGIEPFLKIGSLMSVHNYLTDPRCWNIMPASLASQQMSQYPGKLTTRRVTPPPPPRTCSLLLSNQYSDENVIRELLRCCDEFINERSYLEKISTD